MNKQEAEKIARIFNPNELLTSGVKKVTLEVVIHRAKTNINESLGVVSGFHRNIFLNFWMQLTIKIRGYIRRWRQS